MKAPATLNARFVETVTRPGRYGDGRGGYGLCLNVRRIANGRASKSWVQRIRPGGVPTYIGLGRYPFVTLAEARRLALENATAIARGHDPRAGGVPTFSAVFDRVIATKAPSWRNPKSEAQWRASMRDHAAALMGMQVDAIGAGDVLPVVLAIWNTNRETANRIRQRISLTMKLAIAEGHRADNPVDAIGPALPRNGNGRKHHRALPYGRVAGALAAVRESGAWWATKAAFEFLTLTAARSGEVRGMMWSEVDGGVWTVPGERMKSGREHRVPLSARALAILEDARQLADGSGLVFPSMSGRAMTDSTLSKLVRELGIEGTPHGMRSAFRDWGSERTSTAHAVMEAALAHTIRDKAEAAYARSDLLDKRRALMDAWARYLAAESTGRVVELRA